jgi:hypothetical protein
MPKKCLIDMNGKYQELKTVYTCASVVKGKHAKGFRVNWCNSWRLTSICVHLCSSVDDKLFRVNSCN